MPDSIHQLFNVKTIQKLCSSTAISDEQNSIALRWIEWIKNGTLEQEVENYPQFANFILDSLLGYPVKEEWKLNRGKIEFSFKSKNGLRTVGIEAKGTSVKDLFAIQHREKREHETPVKQTWDYIGINNFDYGICTNYRHFVLIDKTKGYSKYHFFDFLDIEKDKEKLKEFVAIFSNQNVLENEFILKLYEESILEEREFTKEFYKLYHETRLMLIKEFEHNSLIDKKELIHFAQLFLNRIIFIFFAEDSNKIKKRLFEDSILKILEVGLVSEHSRYVTDTIVNLFKGLDKGSQTPVEIFGFNGGLFSEAIPNEIYFKDLNKETFFKDVLKYSKLKNRIQANESAKKILDRFGNKLNPIIKNLLNLASFDFQTELNVNILGHILEQSITDLEELNLEKLPKDKKISKRKKDGIYYTPEYITEYICKNTIIPYLSKTNVNTVEELVKEYKNDIEELEKKLENIKILDPACGSGAFLLKTVDILLLIYKEIQILKEGTGEYTVFKKNKKSGNTAIYSLEKWNEEEEARRIIENNICGVDINEESVEITKLSLFLKIVTNNRKLIDLSKNIKVGNSLIDNILIDKRSFNWNSEFKNIMDNGGFDIVIGNPPYVKSRDQSIAPDIKKEIEKKFQTPFKMWDLYIPFVELGLSLLKENGNFGMIIKDTIGQAAYTSKLVDFIERRYNIYQIDFFPKITIFENVGVQNKIIFIKNTIPNNSTLRIQHGPSITETKILPTIMGPQKFILAQSEIKLNQTDTITLGDICFTSYGLRLNSDKYDKEYKFKKEDLLSKDFNKINNRIYTEGKYIDEFCIIKELYLEWDTDRCPKRLVRPTFPELYNPEKILMSRQKRVVAYSDQRHICDNTIIMGILAKDLKNINNNNIRKYYTNLSIDRTRIEKTSEKFNLKYILALLNSKLIRYLIEQNSKGRFDIYPDDWKRLPIKNLPLEEQIPFIKKAEKLLELHRERHKQEALLLSRIASEFHIEKNLESFKTFYYADSNNFLKKIEKLAKNKINLKKKDEWTEYFDLYKNKIIKILMEIKAETKQLNDMVYDLYDLSTEGRFLIENKNP